MGNKLKTFSEINLARCNSPEGFNLAAENLMYFSVGLAEETGEVCGVIKKLRRGFNKREYLKTLKKLRNEWWERAEFKASVGLGHPATELMPEWPADVVEARWHAEMKTKLADEMADVFSYLDLLASKANIDLKRAIKHKFNIVTKEMELSTEFQIDDVNQI